MGLDLMLKITEMYQLHQHTIFFFIRNSEIILNLYQIILIRLLMIQETNHFLSTGANQCLRSLKI